MKQQILKPLLIILLTTIIASCEKKEDIMEIPMDYGFTHGAFIINEGNFGHNNASISHYDETSEIITNGLYTSINNNLPIGDIAQSMDASGETGFIVVNNSQKVIFVSMNTFTVEKELHENITAPRYIRTITESKAYLTDGSFPGKVHVIDLVSKRITKSITVGNSPENIILSNDKAYVCNGLWGNDNTVSIIDTNTDELLETVTLADGTIDLTADADGNIWVLCSGKTTYDDNWTPVSETDSKLIKMNGTNYTIEKEFIIGQTGDFFSPKRIDASPDGKIIYFAEANGVYSIDYQSDQISTNPIISQQFYGLDVSPSGNIYCTESNPTSNGFLYIFDSTGNEIIKREVGMFPNGTFFN